MKHGVDLLLKARTEIYKGLILNDLRSKIFIPPTVEKRWIIDICRNFNTGYNKVSDKDLWNLSKHTEKITENIKIKDIERFIAHSGDPKESPINYDSKTQTFWHTYNLEVIQTNEQPST